MIDHHRYRLGRGALSLAALALTASALSCQSSMEVRVPRVASPTTGKFQYGKFIWFDLATDDVAAAKQFYGELFGWTFSDLGTGAEAYTVVEHRGRFVAGIVAADESDEEPLWVGSISVPDVNRAVEQTREQGGTVHAEAHELKDRGRTALVSDPQGAPVAFLEASGGDPPDREAAVGDFAWVELWTPDVAASLGFYVSLGYTAGGLDTGGDEPYRVLKVAGEPQAGVVKVPWESTDAGWLPLVMVDDLATAMQRVVALGGQVVVAPTPEFAEGRAAVIADPTGAVLALAR